MLTGEAQAMSVTVFPDLVVAVYLIVKQNVNLIV
jgi:hypothetical protein